MFILQWLNNMAITLFQWAKSLTVCVSGNPALRNLKEVPSLSKSELSSKLNFDIDDYIVILKHPLSSAKDEAYQQMKVTLDAIKLFVEKHNVKAVGVFPNTNPSSYDILKAIEDVSSEKIKFFKILPRDEFVNVMRHSLALIGNSSMGILEAPFYKLPVINVSDRQKGRLNAGNVEFVDYDESAIVKALDKAAFNKEYRQLVKNIENPYGDGGADLKIVSFLKSIDVKGKSWFN
jgi:GDP/UDP-N,N'-diacetylbacillosamine 2-epimerase (hydrolysing)